MVYFFFVKGMFGLVDVFGVDGFEVGLWVCCLLKVCYDVCDVVVVCLWGWCFGGGV